MHVEFSLSKLSSWYCNWFIYLNVLASRVVPAIIHFHNLLNNTIPFSWICNRNLSIHYQNKKKKLTKKLTKNFEQNVTIKAMFELLRVFSLLKKKKRHEETVVFSFFFSQEGIWNQALFLTVSFLFSIHFLRLAKVLKITVMEFGNSTSKKFTRKPKPWSGSIWWKKFKNTNQNLEK